jgi:UDP-N-acetylglucosamine 3-dehydrogenase
VCQIRVGIVGGGVMAHTHLTSLVALPDARVCALAAPVVSPPVSDLCGRNDIPVGPDIDWLLGQFGLDALIIATPTDTHVELVRRAAHAGLHVFCEKPLARVASDAEKAIRECDDAGVKLNVGHVVRYFPAYAEIVRLVHAGLLGPPAMAKCRRVSGPPAATRDWYGDETRSGGVLMDMGVQDFDWLVWCLGPVDRVSALSSPSGSGQVAMVSLAHASGAISAVELSWMEPKGFSTYVEVSGPEGLIRYDSTQSAGLTITMFPAGDGTGPVTQAPLIDSGTNAYRRELAEAISWFGGGPPPRTTATDAATAVAIAEAAAISAKRREPVRLAELSTDGAI